MNNIVRTVQLEITLFSSSSPSSLHSIYGEEEHHRQFPTSTVEIELSVKVMERETDSSMSLFGQVFLTLQLKLPRDAEKEKKKRGMERSIGDDEKVEEGEVERAFNFLNGLSVVLECLFLRFTSAFHWSRMIL